MKKLFISLLFITLFFSGVVVSLANVSILPVTKFNSADMVNEVPAGWNPRVDAHLGLGERL